MKSAIKPIPVIKAPGKRTLHVEKGAVVIITLLISYPTVSSSKIQVSGKYCLTCPSLTVSSSKASSNCWTFLERTCVMEGSGNNLKCGHFFSNGASYLRGLVVYRKRETGNGRESGEMYPRTMIKYLCSFHDFHQPQPTTKPFLW